MKYALVSIMGNVGSTLNTQGGGYGLIATKMMRDTYPQDQIDVNPKPETWHDYDHIFVCEGVNFVEGSFNVPGGPQQIHHDKMKAMGGYTKGITFINQKFDFEKFNKRIDIKYAQFPKGDLINLFIETGLKSKKCVIGDSHALSVWRPGFGLDWTAGRTLHGFLKRNTPELINDEYDETILYFGCIDVRFHLMRQENPKQATIDLFTKYVEFAKQLKDCTLATIIPVEHTSRKIPGTGLYKKKPFFGTRSERQELVEIANNIIKTSGLKYILWLDEWNDSTGEKMLDILESKQSVHLKPKNYLYLNQIIDVSK